MIFRYDPEIGKKFPSLFTSLVLIRDLPENIDLTDQIAHLHGDALCRLAGGSESEILAIRAWRAAFSAMGLKPTQYRCASEALLRRLRKDGDLPTLNPVVDACNATSAALAVPVAAFDLDRIAGNLTVRYATGAETYSTFGGSIEHPNPGEVVFADDAGVAHARRWTNRQSAASAVSPDTQRVLVVIEGLHDEAEADVVAARDTLSELFTEAGAVVRKGILRSGVGHFQPEEEDI
ncbi:B3/B4 domain-containing protein [Nitratireductor sp.]|uniref:B3/B4 domain-containing protein n=1 Tax=Nitratireductor sp. TaxID=1872084 RepID=UPI0025CE0B3F|nr:phenylalanine--tRNA ligase beta subunit-related protein [Nitratireductor sp.]